MQVGSSFRGWHVAQFSSDQILYSLTLWRIHRHYPHALLLHLQLTSMVGARITMSHVISTVLSVVTLSLVTACSGRYPAPIRSARDIDRASSSENMVVIVSLPLEDWPKLQKFTALEHFRILKEMASQITDEHISALSQLKLPKLRDVSLANCSKVTDDGLQALASIPSIQGLQLIGTSITDRGMHALATGFPHLTGINVEGCRLLTVNGFLNLTGSTTITDVSLSLDPFSQEQIESMISAVPNVSWWTIRDPRHQLDHASLRRLGESRKITIQVVDENNLVKGITMAQQNGPANGSRPFHSEKNQTSPSAGPYR